MSHEGFVRALCENGHQRLWDCYDAEPETCSCGARFVWHRHVDETNGYDEETDPPLEPLVAPQMKTCDLGVEHVIVEGTFKKPEGL